MNSNSRALRLASSTAGVAGSWVTQDVSSVAAPKRLILQSAQSRAGPIAGRECGQRAAHLVRDVWTSMLALECRLGSGSCTIRTEGQLIEVRLPK